MSYTLKSTSNLGAPATQSENTYAPIDTQTLNKRVSELEAGGGGGGSETGTSISPIYLSPNYEQDGDFLEPWETVYHLIETELLNNGNVSPDTLNRIILTDTSSYLKCTSICITNTPNPEYGAALHFKITFVEPCEEYLSVYVFFIDTDEMNNMMINTTHKESTWNELQP